MTLTTLVAFLALATTPAAPGADLTTPRRALQHFVESARAGEWAAAGEALDVRQAPDAARRDVPRLARELAYVLEHRVWIDWARISDEPAGDPADGPGADRVADLSDGVTAIPLRLVRGADDAWRVGPGAVAAIPRLYAQHGPGWLGRYVPPVLYEIRVLKVQAWQWVGLAIALAIAAFVGVVLVSIGRRIALRLAQRTRVTWDEKLIAAAAGPTRLLLAFGTFAVVVRALRLAPGPDQVVAHLLRIGTIATFVWIAIRAVSFLEALIEERLERVAPDEGSARARRTQLMVLKRVADVVIVVVGAALVLVQFDAMRSLGTSLLASAGVAGIVIGLAAQRSIATLLAGIQLSLTQPVRVGDVVVIEGEWGRIEEITLTYVVVKIWDLRRLVIPMGRILEAPFQNWTRQGGDILGTVFIHADHRVPVPAVRAELERFVRTRPEWDGKVVGLQVTDTSDRTVELRALVSSDDSGKSWDLRCAVREHLVGFLQELEGGACLPRVRVEAHGLEPRGAIGEGRNVAVPPVPGADRRPVP